MFVGVGGRLSSPSNGDSGVLARRSSVEVAAFKNLGREKLGATGDTDPVGAVFERRIGRGRCRAVSAVCAWVDDGGLKFAAPVLDPSVTVKLGTRFKCGDVRLLCGTPLLCTGPIIAAAAC